MEARMERGVQKRRHTVVGGVVILTFASLLVKVIGVLYKIPLTYLLGDEGMGYFNAAYTIYAWLYMISTAGLPIAVSILISEADAQGDLLRVKKIVRIAGGILFALGITTSLAMLFFSRVIATLLGSPDARYCMVAIAPTLFFICVTSLFRGYFQGYQSMAPTAVSQVMEAMGKLLLGMAFAKWASAVGKPLPIVCAYAISGVTAGTAVGTLYLLVRYIFRRREEKTAQTNPGSKEKGKSLARRLFRIALPVTVSASVLSLTGLIDLGMMIRRLVHIGYTQVEATALFGNYTTLVVPVFNLPSILVTPIATGVIPALSRARTAGDLAGAAKLSDWAFRIATLFAIPASIGLCVFARPILALLYPAASVETAYQLLAYISPGVYFLCVLTVSNAVLQASGASHIPMISMIAGGAVKTVAGFILMGIPSVGIAGAPLGTVACYFVGLMINVGVMGKKAGYLPKVKEILLMPLTAGLPGIGLAGILYDRFFQTKGALGTVFCIAGAVVFYLVFSLLFGVVKKEDIAVLLGKHRRAREE